MCGISGVFASNYSNKKIFERFERAVHFTNRVQARRGPDDEGIFVSPPVILGHRRLAIIDLSKEGCQPMSYNSGKLQIVFNGEIYNFLELRHGLERRGYEFKTRTDTEVILALYQEYGPKSFSMLRGMFAFAIWDSLIQKIFLVKDRYGIKPLYYYSDAEKLIFASTVKAIKQAGLIVIEKDPKALIGFLLFGSVPLPLTTYKNISALPSGHYLERSINGQEKLVRYYEPLLAFQTKKQICFDIAVREIRHRLEESIRLHLISDAPLGVFLSGGLDSSAIAAITSLKREKPITTLSVVFDEEGFSEKFYQDLMVRKIKSVHREIKITARDFFDSFEEIFKAMDQPTIDGVNTFFIAEAARHVGLKVVLSGLGGDEIFCGYSHLKRAPFLRGFQKLPYYLKMPLALFSGRYAKVKYFLSSGLLNFYLGIRGLFATEEVANILDINLSEVNDFLNFEMPNVKTLNQLHPIDLLSCLELKFYLQNQLLKDTDFMSMHYSIEVRVPFLDYPLVEYLSGLPPFLKLHPKINKPLLVEAVKGLIPEEILNRKKMGFTFPFERWLKKFPTQLVPEKARGLMVQFEAGKLHWSRPWSLIVLSQFLN